MLDQRGAGKSTPAAELKVLVYGISVSVYSLDHDGYAGSWRYYKDN